MIRFIFFLMLAGIGFFAMYYSCSELKTIYLKDGIVLEEMYIWLLVFFLNLFMFIDCVKRLMFEV